MKRSKHELFVFPPKKILIKRRHCSIGQSSCSMTSKGSIDWLLESSRAWSFFTRVFANQPKPTPVCIRSINRSNRCIPVRLFFLFCSRVFISRSYKNRSITFKLFHYHDEKVNFIFPQSAKELSRTPLSVLHLNLEVLYVGLLDRWIKFWSETIQMNATDW